GQHRLALAQAGGGADDPVLVGELLLHAPIDERGEPLGEDLERGADLGAVAGRHGFGPYRGAGGLLRQPRTGDAGQVEERRSAPERRSLVTLFQSWRTRRSRPVRRSPGLRSSGSSSQARARPRAPLSSPRLVRNTTPNAPSSLARWRLVGSLLISRMALSGWAACSSGSHSMPVFQGRSWS